MVNKFQIHYVPFERVVGAEIALPGVLPRPLVSGKTTNFVLSQVDVLGAKRDEFVSRHYSRNELPVDVSVALKRILRIMPSFDLTLLLDEQNTRTVYELVEYAPSLKGRRAECYDALDAVVEYRNYLSSLTPQQLRRATARTLFEMDFERRMREIL